MSTLNLDRISAPQPIIDKLKDLSSSICFDKQSRKGSNGWLFFGINIIHKQRVAVKFYDWGGDPQFHAEPQRLALLDSENIISILDAALVNEDYAYFVTPFYQRGDLDDELMRGIHGNLRAISMVRDVLSGLSHLHAARLLHRDLKPQNILLNDDNRAVIGDFGSVKHLPEGHSIVPGSGHSLIYRPPESIQHNLYGIAGDIYQVGMLLYQLLGGKLPYEETAWLNKHQLRKYWEITDPVDRQLFATDIIKDKIKRGQIIDLSTLPPWVCQKIRRTIPKACNLNPERRYKTCSEFLAHITKIRPYIHDWRIEDGFPTCYNGKIYRIVTDRRGINRIQKKVSGTWRFDNSFTGGTVEELVTEIEQKIC